VKTSTVVADVDVPLVDATLPKSPKDPERVEALAAQWGVASALTRFHEAVATEAA